MLQTFLGSALTTATQNAGAGDTCPVLFNPVSAEIANLRARMHEDYQNNKVAEVADIHVTEIKSRYEENPNNEVAHTYIAALENAQNALYSIQFELDPAVFEKHLKQIQAKKIQLATDIDIRIANGISKDERNTYLAKANTRRRSDVLSFRITDTGEFEIIPRDQSEIYLVDYHTDLKSRPFVVGNKTFFVNLYDPLHPNTSSSVGFAKFSKMTNDFCPLYFSYAEKSADKVDLTDNNLDRIDTIFIINSDGHVFTFPKELQQIFTGTHPASKEYVEKLHQARDLLNDSPHKYSAEEFAAYNFILEHDLIPDALEKNINARFQDVKDNLSDAQLSEKALQNYIVAIQSYIEYINSLTVYDNFYKMKLVDANAQLAHANKLSNTLFSCHEGENKTHPWLLHTEEKENSNSLNRIWASLYSWTSSLSKKEDAPPVDVKEEVTTSWNAEKKENSNSLYGLWGSLYSWVSSSPKKEKNHYESLEAFHRHLF